MFKIVSISFLILSLLLSCRGIRTIPENYTARQERERPHVLAIFLDGTRDKPHKKIWKNSHVKRIHDLADTNIKSLYVEGVGAGNRLIQAAKASTTKERVMKAYRFLSENYQPNDSICLFGFSRGANQCRILSSIIYSIGIIDLKQIKSEDDKQQLLLDLYEQYVDTIDASRRKLKLARFINNWELDHPGQKVSYDTSGTTMIELMGIWDTVEAFNVKDRFETTTPIPAHLNQLYNVKKLFHAVSLDDNRAFTYTPILATHKDVARHSHQVADSIVSEVWFNGSHKDVGGGVANKKKDQLSGISITWMLAKVKPYSIFRNSAFEINTFGEANNMRRGPFLKMLSPGDTLRAINKYLDLMNTGTIKVHQSVIDRLAAGKVQHFKMKKGRLDWYDWEPFRDCFIKDGLKRIFRKENCTCIEVVN